MERTGFDGPVIPLEATANGVRFASPSSSLPDYSSKAVQDSLQHLASIDLIDLCNEAKVERCRSSRDLRNCGRPVESVLTSCGHASLCAECSQRCENCPICRTPLPKNGNVLQPRLYYECVNAGLVSKVYKFQGKDDSEADLTVDVQRLYSLFDVALENNLCCLICQYVTDVCMDENAVSSDPVIAFLLDEVVVKDWCKRTFKNVMKDVRGIYNLDDNDLNTKLGALLTISSKLSGLCNVLEVLNLSFKDTHSAKLDDLHILQESILKTKQVDTALVVLRYGMKLALRTQFPPVVLEAQHMEMMMWCIRHDFLVSVKSRHNDFFSWRTLVRERKSSSIKRAWPEPIALSGESIVQDNSNLFIEDALLNLEDDRGCDQENAIELEVASLHKDGGSSFFRSKVEGFGGFYPFEDVRAAVDILFLSGSSDMVVAKRAIFLYYLFDRQWTKADDDWRHIIDDFSATFNVTRNSLLESFTYYLLDDHTDEALQEACRLLPEISGPETHPKIAKVLLERQNPDAALMFLRWSGRDNREDLMSLSEAVTAVRVRVECALLTEAFMYQRNLCLKVREKQLKHKLPMDGSDDLEDEVRIWTDWVLVLVTEICSLCIRRNIVDGLIELPWNSDEERHLHKCLLDYATADPRTTAGSLLVVYYLQRHRYIEAYHIDSKLCSLENSFLSKNDVDEMVLDKMKSATHWRSGLVNKSLELLPEVEQQQLKAGNFPEDLILCRDEIDFRREAEMPGEQDQHTTMPSASSSSLLFPTNHESFFQSSNSGIIKPDGFAEFTSPKETPFNAVKNFKLDNMLTPGIRSMRSPTRFFQDAQLDELSPPVEQNGLTVHFPEVTPKNSRTVMAKPGRTPSSNRGLLDDSPQDRYKTAYSKRLSPGDDSDRLMTSITSADAMDISWSPEKNGLPASGVQRWRSDETSDEEEQQPSVEKLMNISSRTTPLRRSSRRGRPSRR